MKIWQRILIIWLIVIIAVFLFIVLTPQGRDFWNRYHGGKDTWTEEQRRTVEAVCRAMIASWEEDEEVYLKYRNSEIEEERAKAEYAKASANRTAESYNAYLLQNAYIFSGDMPDDIYGAIEQIR